MSGEINLRFPSSLEGMTVEELDLNPSDFADTIPDGLKQFELILKGESIVNVQVSDDTNTLVIFRPTAATRKAVISHEGWDVDLTVDDPNGIFSPRNPQRITGSHWCDNTRTLLVYTENQS